MKITNSYFEAAIKHYDETKTNPATRGEWYAIRSYRFDERDENGIIIMTDMGFAENIADMMATFEAAGIDELIIAESSTALMECLNIIINRGWQVIGTWNVPGDDWNRARYGLRIKR